MRLNYIQRVIKETPTRLWINNPTGDELKHALSVGAISGTSNPSYCSKLIQREPAYIRSTIDGVVREIEDNDIAADVIYQKVTQRFMEAFVSIYDRSSGSEGFVTMQDSPNDDENPESIVDAALRHQKVGRNYMAKIPVTEAGMEAMKNIIERDIPICATECFSVSQTIAMCELYETISGKSGKFPPFYITHITGIFDEELKAFVDQEKTDIAPELLHQAGCIVAQKVYRVIKERGYSTTLLCGGARSTHHFTEFVGGDVHVTLNWSTVTELNDADGPVLSRIGSETPEESITELCRKVPNFRRAYDEDGLSHEEFGEFAPLQRFRNSFVEGWDRLREEIEIRRQASDDQHD